MGPRLYLDANIVIYAFENTDEISERLRSLIAAASSPQHRFLATSELTLAEIVVVPLRNGNRRLIDIYESITIGNSFVYVGTVSREVLWLAAILRSKHRQLRLPDAIHIATAMLFGCDYFLSGDLRLSGSFSIEQMSEPVQIPKASISVVRPEMPVIEKLVIELSKR
jgi:predicted nucleic acid-binding protein